VVFTPVLSRHWDDADSFTIEGYTRHGGYTALPKALAMEPDALIALVKSKQTGTPVRTSAAPRASNVVNLIDALRKSLDAEKGTATPKETGRKVTARASTAPKKPAAAGKAPARGKSLKKAG